MAIEEEKARWQEIGYLVEQLAAGAPNLSITAGQHVYREHAPEQYRYRWEVIVSRKGECYPPFGQGNDLLEVLRKLAKEAGRGS